MAWERLALLVLAIIGTLTVIGWLAHAVLRRGRLMRPSISVSLTVCNAAPQIEGVIRSLLILGSRLPGRWVLRRIAVIDRGSTDNTSSIVRRLGRAHPVVQLYEAPAGPETLPDTITIAADATAGWSPLDACDAICSLLE